MYAPLVGIESPEAGAVVSGIVPVRVFADDAVRVSYVALYDGYHQVGRVFGDRTWYDFAWDTTKTPSGEHLLSAVAVNPANRRGVDRITITVKAGA